MRAILIATLLVAPSVRFCPGSHAQPGERDRKIVEATKVKAELGDAGAQNNLGLCYPSAKDKTFEGMVNAAEQAAVLVLVY